MNIDNVTVCIKAFARPIKLKNTLESVIGAGLKNIIVGYDGPDNLKDMHKEIIQSLRGNILFECFPFNYGLAAVRNRIIEDADSEFILLLDDDQYVPNDICSVLDYFDGNKEIGVISFPWRLINPHDLPQHYKNIMRKLGASFPYILEIADFVLSENVLIFEKCMNQEYDFYRDNIYAKYFDYVPMFGFFRRKIFNEIKFDNKFIIGGEHQDFFLSLKTNTNYKCAVCLTIIVDHDLGEENNNFPYKSYRHGEKEHQSMVFLYSKWGIKQIINGSGVQFFYENKDDISIKNGILEIKSKGLKGKIKTINYMTISDELEKINIRFDDRLIEHLVGNFDINERLEGEVSTIVKTFLPICDYFVDVGANVGYYTYLALKYMKPNSKILSYEPDKQFYDYLIKKYSNLITKQYLEIYQMSISDRDGVEQFYLSTKSFDSGSTVEISEPHTSQTIKCAKLDTVLNDIKRGDITLIKVDVEGGEEKVLHGLSETCQKLRPILIVELHKAILERNNLSPDDIVKYINNKNYRSTGIQRGRFLFTPSELSIETSNDINLENIKKYYKTLRE